MGVTLIKKLKGFSLVELLVSMTILLIIMSFSLPVFISSGEKIKKNRAFRDGKKYSLFYC
ncbi:PilW family protein [Dictyoglomus thermophilum]|uniref:PilW family protein n=1 Tax=Dictyoglomus thermophilum TaxID=14 RepID=UPI0021CC9B14|nr:type II secretion system protein [Dictyoglomus thermophilum]